MMKIHSGNGSPSSRSTRLPAPAMTHAIDAGRDSRPDTAWPEVIVEEASLLKIDPFPWAAPLEDVRLKRQ
jgi:hypothetical protein